MVRDICKALKTTFLLFLVIWAPGWLLSIFYSVSEWGFGVLPFYIAFVLIGITAAVIVHRETMVWKPHHQRKTKGFYRHFSICMLFAFVYTVLPMVFPKFNQLFYHIARFISRDFTSWINSFYSPTGVTFFSPFTVDIVTTVGLWLVLFAYFLCRMLFDNSVQEFPKEMAVPSPKASAMNAV